MKAPASMAGAFCRSVLCARLARRHVHVQSILALDGLDRESSVKQRLPALCVIHGGHSPTSVCLVGILSMRSGSGLSPDNRLNSAYSPDRNVHLRDLP